MKISIITWDACFRESYHTVDSFCSQSYDTNFFEFIWVEYYKNDNPVLNDKILKYTNAKLINLNNSQDEPWHLGKCINAGIRESNGEIVIIPDGDIIVQPDFLQNIDTILKNKNSLVVYFRRWDEPETEGQKKPTLDINRLKKVCRLHNPTNYAGTVALNRETLAAVGGYEEHIVFSKAGANGLELYIRLRNASFPILWHEIPIYHPYHPNTGFSEKRQNKLEFLKQYFDWINPYSGIEQSWIIYMRSKDLSTLSNSGQIDDYLQMEEYRQIKYRVDNLNRLDLIGIYFKQILKQLY